MKNSFFIKVMLCASILLSVDLAAQRKMERLDRGLVAVQTSGGVFLSWRVYGTDPKDVAFNIYRNGTKVNASPITGASNMLDASGSASATYTVRPVTAGTEQAVGGSAEVWGSQVRTVTLSNRPSNNHQPNDINVGDLDGDGKYDLVVKWYPNNAKDNAHDGVTDNTYLAAYKMDGTFMWIVDLGRNIRSGAHYVQHLVGDYDADGKAEVACKTAPGARDATGTYLSTGPAASDNDATSYVNSAGRVLSGPEYLTIFNGLTGKEMETINYPVPRGNVSGWGDSNGNRGDRTNATNAYLDGVKPSMIFQRGYYTRLTLSAIDWNGRKLSIRWIFDSNNTGSERARGQGNHSLMAADVDGDGFDEILPGACAIDHDGKFMWATGFGHGDANHVGDFDPASPGLEIFLANEQTGSQPDHYMVRARDGQVLWRHGSGHDNGRGMTGDIDARYSGQESWSNSVEGTYRADGTRITTAKPGSCNFRVYWDGDLQDELPNGSSENTNNRIDKWNGNGTGQIFALTGRTCNGTKATPNIVADLIGDWREEIILHDGANRLYIHTTTIPTQHKLYTLMHDPVYRNAISWQQSSYNQPPHLGFWLGAGIDKVPTPNIVLVGGADCNGVAGGSAFVDACGICVGGNTGKTACVVDCNGDQNGTATLDKCGVCSGGKSPYSPCVGSMEAEQACNVDGVLNESVNTGFSGTGYVNVDNAVGSSVTWRVNSTIAQTATLTFRFANGGGTDRDGALSVNNTPQGTLDLPPTGAWTTWQNATIKVSLAAGTNEIILASAAAEGLANIDLISYSQGVSQIQCVVTNVADAISNEEYGVYPNPTQSVVSWNGNKAWNLFNAKGQEMAHGVGNTLDLSTFTEGIYILKLENNFIKVVKE